MDIGGEVEARKRESLRAKGDGITHKDLETGPHHTGKSTGRQETEGGDRGAGRGDTAGRVPAKSKGGVDTAKGMV